MTMRLGIVANDAGERGRREHARELGAGVVIAIHRLAQLAQRSDFTNQAFTRQLDQTYRIIGDYCLRSGSNVSVVFADEAVFVSGQLLKGSREAYEAAAELGGLFERLFGSELHLRRDLTRADLLAFAQQISRSVRSGEPFHSSNEKIRLRAVGVAARLRGHELETLGERERIVRVYASAVVVMRKFFEDLGTGRHVLPRRIKRVAQSLVDLAVGGTPAFLGVTEVRNANFDEAGRAVNTAILAVSMAREITQDRATLSQIAMAAMMHDVARPRALSLSADPRVPGMPAPVTLSEDHEDRLAAGAAAVLTVLGRVDEPSITRTVVVFEALWLRRRAWLGPIYRGNRAPTLHARFVAIARRYNDLLTPEPGFTPKTPDHAVAVLEEELHDAEDRTVLRTLLSALGLVPMGTVVQLTTGEIAEVVRGSKRHGDSPRVRLARDARGQAIAPVEMELSREPQRQIARIVSAGSWKESLNSIASTPIASEPRRSHAADGYPPPSSVEPRSEGPSDAAKRASYASFPSVGTSPSAVASAMGKMIDGARRVSPADSTAAERSILESSDRHDDGARGRAARPDEPREPTARGNLAATPLPHVLVYMLDHSLSGSVVFDGTQGADVIAFTRGVPGKVKLRDRVALLGQVLVHGGSLPPAAVEPAIAAARHVGMLLGEYLVAHELVSEEALAWALEAQLLNRVAYLTNLPSETTYAYYRDVDLLEGSAGADVALGCPLNPVLASVRNWMDRGRVRATLDRIGAHPLILHEHCALSNLALVPDERATLDMLRSENLTLLQCEGRNTADEESVSSLVYTLAVTRQLVFPGQTKAPMGVPGPPLASSSIGSSRPSAARMPAAAAPATRMPASPTKAPPRASEARPASRTMMPAALPPTVARSRPTLRPLVPKRPTMPGVQAASTAEPRKAAGPAPAPAASSIAAASPRATVDDGFADAEAALAAMRSFHLAEDALQRGDAQGAERLAQDAVEQDPTRPDYIVLLAWIRALEGDAAALSDAIATLTHVLAPEPSNERALLYRGRLFVRVHRFAEARADFERLLDARPRHPEAERELRAVLVALG